MGIDTSSSGNTAANLAHSNFKPFEHWKPGLSSSAGKAALLAHQDGGKLDLWNPSATDEGHSAAGIAMGKQTGLSPRVDYGVTDDGRKKALLAATLSVSGRDRARSSPSPARPSYPDAQNASHNALSAASVAHKPTVASTRMSDEANEAARLTHMQGNINRSMFTEHPPVNVAPMDQRHSNHALRGATMAHNKQAEDAQAAQQVPNAASANAKNYARFDLQEQAQKLAQQRLSKLDPDGVLAYREHYGYSNAPSRNKLSSIRHRRARSSDDGGKSRKSVSEDDDAARAGRIRHQMSRFNDQLASVDTKKKNDRDTLMAAAEKSVRERMSKLDSEIFNETGRVTPAMMEEWEAKARQRAAVESEKRLENHGMVNVGGGKYMDQTEVEKIAASRMQPTLDEINANAERQRARDEEVRLDREQRERQAATEKQREKETKEEVKKTKEEEKAQKKLQKRQEKDEAKKAKEEEKHIKKVEKQGAKEQDAAERDQAREDGADGTRSQETHSSDANDAVGASETGALKKNSKKSRYTVTKELTQGEKAAMYPTTEDPPGVPVTFSGQPVAPKTEPTADLHAQQPPSERDSGKGDNLEIQTSGGPVIKKNEKRDSRVKSWLGKLRPKGRQQRDGSGGQANGSGGQTDGNGGTVALVEEEKPERIENEVTDEKGPSDAAATSKVEAPMGDDRQAKKEEIAYPSTAKGKERAWEPSEERGRGGADERGGLAERGEPTEPEEPSKPTESKEPNKPTRPRFQTQPSEDRSRSI